MRRVRSVRNRFDCTFISVCFVYMLLLLLLFYYCCMVWYLLLCCSRKHRVRSVRSLIVLHRRHRRRRLANRSCVPCFDELVSKSVRSRVRKLLFCVDSCYTSTTHSTCELNELERRAFVDGARETPTLTLAERWLRRVVWCLVAFFRLITFVFITFRRCQLLETILGSWLLCNFILQSGNSITRYHY